MEYNAKLCLMNMAVHGLTGVIKSGDEANTFYQDASAYVSTTNALYCFISVAVYALAASL